MRKILADIQSGAFAKEWLAECRAGGPHFAQLREQEQDSGIEQVGARLRAMMPWSEEGKAKVPSTEYRAPSAAPATTAGVSSR
jgi:ketol-acid reductoisomerase